MLLLLTSSHAFTLLESDWAYQSDPIEHPVVLDYATFPSGFASEEDFEASVVEAIRMWNSHPTADFRFRYAGISSASDGMIPIRYVEQSGSERIGIAVRTFFEASRETTEARIELFGSSSTGPVDWYVNPDLDGLQPTQTDLISTLAHELGHVAGLDHTLIDAALMSPSRLEGTGYRELHIDDRTGLETLYGTTAIEVQGTIEGEDTVEIEANDAFARITIENIGNKVSVLPTVAVVGGPAFLVNAEAPEPVVDLAPGETLVVELPITVGGCESDVFDVVLQVTDRNGSNLRIDASADIVCPVPTPPPEEEESKGCATTGSAKTWWSFLARR